MSDSKKKFRHKHVNRFNLIASASIESLETRRLFSVPLLNGVAEDLVGNVGADAADPVRNVAYVYDQGSNHILAVNTSSGTTAFATTPAAAVSGLAVSVDDTRLFAAEPTALQVEVFSLPKMTLLTTLNVGVAINAIYGVANNRFVGDTGSMTGFNALTGATLWSEPDQYDGIIHVNQTGTMLYTRARGLSGNDGGITVYDISGTGNPVSDAEIPGPTGANSTDFAVDAANGHAYMGDGGGNGVEVTVLSSGSQTNWTFDGGGSVNGIAALPGAADMFASTFNGVIGEFNQLGTEVAAYSPSSGVSAETMVVTPNNNVLSTYGTGINITGLTTINVTQTAAPVPTVTTFTPASNSISFGSSVTLNATVASSGENPTGLIYFYNNGVSLGETELLSNGTASLAVSSLPVGTDSLLARYVGDVSNYASNSSSSAIVVSPLGTITHVNSAQPSTAEAGSTVTITGTVSPATENSVIPTGQVFVYQGQAELGSISLQSTGAFFLPVTTLPVGTDSVVIKYSGDGNYTASTSSSVSITITPRVVGSGISLTTIGSVVPDPVSAGASVTLTGVVTSAAGTVPVPTGSVTIYSNGSPLGDATLDAAGQFTFSTSTLASGTDSVYAAYLGDTTYAISSSTVNVVTVIAAGSQLPSITTLTSSLPNPAEPSTEVTIDGTVASEISGSSSPAGTVNVFDNGVSLGTPTLQSDGTFSMQVSGLTLGDNELTGVYSGDTINAASTSAPLSETIAASIALPTIGKTSVPLTVVAGVKFKSSVPVTVTNYGAVSKGKFLVQLFINQAATLDGNQVMIGAFTKSLNLKDRKSGGVRFAVSSLPATLPAGTYHLLTEVINPTGVETTVVLAQTVQVAEPVIILTATAGAVAPAAVKAGRSGSIVVSITNSGNIDAVGPLDVSVTLAGKTTPLVAISPKTRIKAGKTQRIRVSFKVPTTLLAGEYTPVIQIALDGESAGAQGVAFSVV